MDASTPASSSRCGRRDVDFKRRHIRVTVSHAERTLATPKSGRVRSVPLAPVVAEALARLGQRNESRARTPAIACCAGQGAALRTSDDERPLGAYVGVTLGRMFWLSAKTLSGS
jgi:hypothetical protein